MFTKLPGFQEQVLTLWALEGRPLRVLLDVHLELEVVEKDQVTEPADPGPLGTVGSLQVRFQPVELGELFIALLSSVVFLTVAFVDAVVDFVVGGHVFGGLGCVAEPLVTNQASYADVALAFVFGFDVSLNKRGRKDDKES